MFDYKSSGTFLNSTCEDNFKKYYFFFNSWSNQELPFLLVNNLNIFNTYIYIYW